VPVHPEVVPAAWEGTVEEDVVRAQEAGAADDLNTQAQDSAAVDGARVRVARAEGGQSRAGAVEALLRVRLLLGEGIGEESFLVSLGVCLGSGLIAMAGEGEGGGGLVRLWRW